MKKYVCGYVYDPAEGDPGNGGSSSAEDRITDWRITHAALGMCNIVEQGGGKVRGIGIVIEKSFMDGATKIRNAGYRLESLVQVKSLAGGKIEFL